MRLIKSSLCTKSKRWVLSYRERSDQKNNFSSMHNFVAYIASKLKIYFMQQNKNITLNKNFSINLPKLVSIRDSQKYHPIHHYITRSDQHCKIYPLLPIYSTSTLPRLLLSEKGISQPKIASSSSSSRKDGEMGSRGPMTFPLLTLEPLLWNSHVESFFFTLRIYILTAFFADKI